MASFINATIDGHKFDALIKVMSLIGALYELR